MKKIIHKKRNVKKKIVKRKNKISTPQQWGKEFEKLAHREPVQFNFIRPNLSGDAFASLGSPSSVVDFLKAAQSKVNERQGHLMDALRYSQTPSTIPKQVLLDTPGKLNSKGVSGIDPLVGNEERPDPALRRNGLAPAHYSNGKYTPWEIVDDWKLEYYTGNALKYVCRHKHKGTPVQDIQKAIDCLIKYKANLEKETSK